MSCDIDDIDDDKLFDGENSESDIEDAAKPHHYFCRIFTESLFVTMANSTNKYVPIYAAKRKASIPDFHAGNFSVDDDDIRAYIGIRMIMAIDTKPSISDYWSTNPALRNHFIADTMSRNRFIDIQHYFHVNDPTQDPSGSANKDKAKEILQNDPLYKVQPLVEAIRENSSHSYNLYRDKH